jgi:hypothetical protein
MDEQLGSMVSVSRISHGHRWKCSSEVPRASVFSCHYKRDGAHIDHMNTRVALQLRLLTSRDVLVGQGLLIIEA